MFWAGFDLCKANSEENQPAECRTSPDLLLIRSEAPLTTETTRINNGKTQSNSGAVDKPRPALFLRAILANQERFTYHWPNPHNSLFAFGERKNVEVCGATDEVECVFVVWRPKLSQPPTRPGA